MKMGRSYCQTHRESWPDTAAPLGSTAAWRLSALCFWFYNLQLHRFDSLSPASVLFFMRSMKRFSAIKLWLHQKKKRKIPMRTFYSLRKREPNNNRKKTAGNLKNQFILSVIFWADLSNICWFQLLRCKNLLLFFVIYESKGRVLGFGNVLVTDWFIDNKNMC